MVYSTRPSIKEILEYSEKLLVEKAVGYRIRNAEMKDISSIVHINRTCLPENYPVYFFEDLLKRYNKAFFVATTEEDHVVGYVMPRIEWKPGFFRKFIIKSLHIVSIAVLPSHRRRGLGYILMAYAMNAGVKEYGCRETYLEVRVSNEPAINLYKKLGYEIIRVLAHYYLDGEDAYLMARPL